MAIPNFKGRFLKFPGDFTFSLILKSTHFKVKDISGQCPTPFPYK